MDKNLFNKSSITGTTLSFTSLEKEEVEVSLATEALLKAYYKETNIEEYTMSRKDLTLQKQVEPL